MAVAVAVAVAVSEGGAVAVAGLTKRSFNHPKRFLNQCLGLLEALVLETEALVAPFFAASSSSAVPLEALILKVLVTPNIY